VTDFEEEEKTVTLLRLFIRFFCTRKNSGTVYTEKTLAHEQRHESKLLKLISRRFTSDITWTSNAGPLVAPLIASDDEYARAE